jgi:hypothetical protein
LLPFILNHLVGVADAGQLADVVTWLDRVAARVDEIVIVDMPHDAAPKFWAPIAGALRVTNDPRVRIASSANALSKVYVDEVKWPSRRTNPKMCRYTALAWSRGRWAFIS